MQAFPKLSQSAAILTLVCLLGLSVPASAQWGGVSPPVDDDNQGTFDGDSMTDIGAEFVADPDLVVEGGGAVARHNAGRGYDFQFTAPRIHTSGNAAIFADGTLQCNPPLPPGTKVTITYAVFFSNFTSAMKAYVYTVPFPDDQPGFFAGHHRATGSDLQSPGVARRGPPRRTAAVGRLGTGRRR